MEYSDSDVNSEIAADQDVVTVAREEGQRGAAEDSQTEGQKHEEFMQMQVRPTALPSSEKDDGDGRVGDQHLPRESPRAGVEERCTDAGDGAEEATGDIRDSDGPEVQMPHQHRSWIDRDCLEHQPDAKDPK